MVVKRQVRKLKPLNKTAHYSEASRKQRNERSREYYDDYRGEQLKRKEIYRNSEEGKKKIKDYQTKNDKKLKAYQKKYRGKPENFKKAQAYSHKYYREITLKK